MERSPTMHGLGRPAPRVGQMADRWWGVVVASVAFALSFLLPTDLAAQQCPPWQSGGEQTATIKNEKIVESSGLAASRRHEGMLWTHNDSGNAPELFLLHTDGATAATAHVLGAEARDWEDMAVAPCSSTSGPKSTETCVYLAEIGDNKEKHDTVKILKFPEPGLPDKRPASIPIEEWTEIEFTYEDGPRNAETLLVHPETAKIYVVEKSDRRRAGVYRVPNRVTEDNTTRTAKKVADLPIDRGIGRQVTAGDVGPDGREFTIRTYVKVYTFCATPGEGFKTAFSASPVISHPKLTIQAEALAYGAKGASLWFTSEGKHAPLVRMDRLESGGGETERGRREPLEPKSKQAQREREPESDE